MHLMMSDLWSLSKIRLSQKRAGFLIIIREEGKRHYVLIKDVNIFTYNYALHCTRKHFYRY